MDQNDTTTVPASGDAGGDIKAMLDSLLADRTKAIRDETYRDIQRSFDKRFAQQDQMIGTLTQVNERLSRFEQQAQQAEEANLEPEERQARTQNRQAQQIWAQKQAAEAANLMNYNYGLALTEANAQGVRVTDALLNPEGAPKLNENPNAWLQAVQREIMRARIHDVETNTQAQIQAALAEERRKILSDKDRTRVETSNTRREAAAGVERSVPSGNAMGMMDRYRQLKSEGKNKEARDLMEQMGKQARNGQLRSLEAG